MDRKNICSLEEWSVNWNDLGNTLLCTHEYMHEYLTVNTIYGIVQRQIKTYADYFPENLQLKRVQYELFKNVLFLQESCATFCSVMQISETVDISDLPSPYSDYYNFFYNCFNSIIKSTHFSYILAESISQACMNIQIHNEIIDFLNSNITHFNNLKNPDSRFQILIKELDRSMLLELIDYCNSQNNDANSDLNNDNYWGDKKPEQLEALNKIVYQSSSDFFSKKIRNIDLLSLDMLRNNSLSWFSILNDYLQITYGDIGFKISSNSNHPYILTDNLLLALECIDTSKIYNRPYFRSSKSLPSNASIGINYKAEHTRFKLHTYLSEYCYYDINGNWYQFNSDGTIHDDAYFHYKTMKNILSPNPLFVIGVLNNADTNSSLKNEINTLYQELKNLCMHSDTKIKMINRYNVMFYLFGRFSQWIDFLVENAKIKFHILEITDENKPTFGVTKKFAMVAFYTTSLPGIFIKCFNTINYSKVLQILDSLAKQNLIAPDYSNERKLISLKMKQAFDAIDALWLEY